MTGTINGNEAVVIPIEGLHAREMVNPEEALGQLIEQFREISGTAATVTIHMQAALRTTDSGIPHDINAPSVGERIASAKALAESLVAQLELAEHRVALVDESLSQEAA